MSGSRDALEARLLERLAALDAESAVAPDPGLREHVLEMARAPRGPVDLALYEWEDFAPGIRLHVMEDEPERSRRAVLVWARPGAAMAAHRHLGDEEILVLQGRLRDARGEYRPGDICRSRTGSVHREEVVGEDDCVCYVVYHGGHEPAEG